MNKGGFQIQKQIPPKQQELDSTLRSKQTNTNQDETIIEPDNDSDVKNFKLFEYRDEAQKRIESLNALRSKSRQMRHKKKQTKIQQPQWSKIRSLEDIKNLDYQNFHFKEDAGDKSTQQQTDEKKEVEYANTKKPQENYNYNGQTSPDGQQKETKSTSEKFIPDEPTEDYGSSYFANVTQRENNQASVPDSAPSKPTPLQPELVPDSDVPVPVQSLPADRFSQSQQQQETDSHMDSGMNGSVDYKNNMHDLEHIMDNEKKLDDIYSNESNLNKLKTRKLPPKGLLANFKLSTAINPNGSISVELNQFKSSLENIYNKGQADALEDLGMDPRNAQDPKTQDAYNYLRDINHTKRDQLDFTKNFRFKQRGFVNREDPSQSKSEAAKEFADEIQDPTALSAFKKKNEQQRAVIAAQSKQKVNPQKRTDLLHVKHNIMQLGHYLQDNHISYGPLYDLFNHMQDNQTHLLTHFERSHKAALDSIKVGTDLRLKQDNNSNKGTSNSKTTAKQDVSDQVHFRQKKPVVPPGDLNFQRLPKLTKMNVHLSEADVEKALRDADQINIGGNVENDNIFRRGRLQDDRDSFTTVVTPSIEFTHPNIDWKNAHVKLANGQQKYHHPVHNYVEDFGYNRPEQNWNEVDDADIIDKTSS